MKKKLFAIVFILIGALSISPATRAFENDIEVGNTDIQTMYARKKILPSSEDPATEAKVPEIEEDNVEVVTDNNIVENKGVDGMNNNTKIELNTLPEKKEELPIIEEKVEAKEITEDKIIEEEVAEVAKNISTPAKKDLDNTYKKETEIYNQHENIVNTETDIDKIEALNQDQAVALLKNKNAELEYKYMGDENQFNVLKEKGHEGYVFLPNVPTDIGYFVDKNTTEVFYFHPSGYLDICE